MINLQAPSKWFLLFPVILAEDARRKRDIEVLAVARIAEEVAGHVRK